MRKANKLHHPLWICLFVLVSISHVNPVHSFVGLALQSPIQPCPALFAESDNIEDDKQIKLDDSFEIVSSNLEVVSNAAGKSEFGDVVSLRKPTSEESSDLFGVAQSESVEVTVAAEMKQRNLGVAIASVLIAISGYLWQFAHPITPVQLLFAMEKASAPISIIGTNSKPTVVDFWAPWCENCKVIAPTLQKVEEEYGDRVNFVMVNGNEMAALPYIEAFGVDAIPHLALVSADGDVETALIGPIPKRILEADINVLLSNANADVKQPIPYRMLDTFVGRPQERRVHFDAEQ